MRMLLQLFASARECRREVLALCTNHLVSARDDIATPFIRTLALLVRKKNQRRRASRAGNPAHGHCCCCCCYSALQQCSAPPLLNVGATAGTRSG